MAFKSFWGGSQLKLPVLPPFICGPCNLRHLSHRATTPAADAFATNHNPPLAGHESSGCGELQRSPVPRKTGCLQQSHAYPCALGGSYASQKDAFSMCEKSHGWVGERQAVPPPAKKKVPPASHCFMIFQPPNMQRARKHENKPPLLRERSGNSLLENRFSSLLSHRILWRQSASQTHPFSHGMIQQLCHPLSRCVQGSVCNNTNCVVFS